MFGYSVTKVEKNLEQRYAIKFCVKMREGTANTYEKVQKASGNDSLSHACISLAQRLCKWVRNGGR
jgi:hypothetical protein